MLLLLLKNRTDPKKILITNHCHFLVLFLVTRDWRRRGKKNKKSRANASRRRISIFQIHSRIPMPPAYEYVALERRCKPNVR